MTEQNKLRKFKLIDREGFVNSSVYNKNILDTFLTSYNTVEGILSTGGDLVAPPNGRCIIDRDGEFQFFEEVFEEDEEKPTQQFTYNGKDYLAVTKHPVEPHTTIVIDINTNEVDCLEDHIIEKYTKLIPWQEKLCEEFADFDTECETISYHGSMSKEDLVTFAKRILELSEGETE